MDTRSTGKKLVEELCAILGRKRGRPLTQRELAAATKVSTGLIPAVFRGEISKAAAVRLALASPDPKLAEGFLVLAGFTEAHLDNLARHRALTKPRIIKGQDLPLEIDERSASILYSLGDAVYLDTSENKAKDLRPFWREVVLLDFPAREFAPKRDKQEIERAYLALREERDKEEGPEFSRGFYRKFEEVSRLTWPVGQRFGTLRLDLVRPFGFTAEFTDLEAALGLPHEHLFFNKLHHEVLPSGEFGAVGYATNSVTVGCWLIDPYDLPNREHQGNAVRDAIQKAPSTVQLFKNLRILGRAVRWEKKR